MKSSMLYTVSLLLIQGLHAEAVAVSCVKAIVISGDTCSNVKVAFDFSACGINEKKLVERVSCEGQVITARTKLKQQRYEARFRKNDQGWGAVNWISLGEVTSINWAESGTQIIPSTTPVVPAGVLPQGATLPIPSSAENSIPTLPVSPTAPATFSGYVDLLYQLNLSGRNAIAGRTLDPIASLLSVQWAEIAFERRRGPLKAYIEFAFGHAVDRFTGISTPGRGDNINSITTPIAQSTIYDPLNNVPTAYVAFTPESVSGLTLTIGKLYTHLGFEFTKSKDNWNYSRSMTFNYGRPFFHTGLGVGYAIVPEKLNSTFYVLNGWDGRVSGEQNKSATLGWNVNWTPNSNFVMNYNLISGSETTDNEAIRQVHEVNASYAVTSSITVAFDYLTGVQKRAVVTPAVLDTKWSGMAAYVRYKADPSFSGTLRYEIFDDTNGAMLPTGTGFYSNDPTKSQKVSAITATVGHQLAEGLDLRLEYRSDTTDRAETGIFKDKDGANTAKQDTVSVSVLATF